MKAIAAKYGIPPQTADNNNKLRWRAEIDQARRKLAAEMLPQWTSDKELGPLPVSHMDISPELKHSA